MSEQIKGSQVVHLASATLGNVSTVYSNDATNSRTKNSPIVTEPLVWILSHDERVPLQKLKELNRKELDTGGYYQCVLALCVIAHHWNEASEQSYPSAQTIAKKTGIGGTHIYNVLNALQLCGLITAVKTRQKGKVTRWRFDWYKPIPQVVEVENLSTTESSTQGTTEPTLEPVLQVVDKQERELELNNQASTDTENLYARVFARVPEHLRLDKNREVMHLIKELIRQSPRWAKEPEKLGDALMDNLGGLSAKGGVMTVLRNLQPDVRAIRKEACTCHELCDGNLHDNNNRGREKCLCTS